jgi:hypothetical protein
VPDDAPRKPRNSAVQRRRGRKGGRPVTNPRTVPPASEAIPPKRRGGINGSARVPVEFPCDPVRWEVFCRAYARCCRKLSSACRRAGLPISTVSDWFRWAAAGQEPYRAQVAKAEEAYGEHLEKVADNLAARNPLEWMIRADPEDFPRERVGLDITSAGQGIEAFFEAARALERGDDGDT